jgi:hypothetical protein
MVIPLPSRPRGATLPALALLLALVVLGAPAPAQAHGGRARIGSAQAGPYSVTVTSNPSPRTGTVDVSVAVTDASGQPVRGTSVSILASPAGHQGAATRYEGQLETGTPNRYHAGVRFPSSGRWELAVRVAGARGSGDARLDVPVSPSLWGVTPSELLVGSAPLIILAVVVAARRLRRSAHPRPGQAEAGVAARE